MGIFNAELGNLYQMLEYGTSCRTREPHAEVQDLAVGGNLIQFFIRVAVARAVVISPTSAF